MISETFSDEQLEELFQEYLSVCRYTKYKDKNYSHEGRIAFWRIWVYIRHYYKKGRYDKVNELMERCQVKGCIVEMLAE